MRVLIVALAASRAAGGGRTYLESIVKALRDRTSIETVILHQNEYWAAGLPGANIAFPTISCIPGPGIDAVGTPWAVRKCNPDVVHFPHEWCPPSLGRPIVVSWQNLGFMSEYSFGERRTRDLTYRSLGTLTLHRANGVVAVSRLVEDMLTKRFSAKRRLDASRIAYIPEAVDFPFEPSSRIHGGSPVVGVTGPALHKNRPFLYKVFARIRQAGFGAPLIMVGGDDTSSLNDRYDIVAVPWLERPSFMSLLECSRLVVYPSRLESFGLPALEAVSRGTPVMVLQSTAMARELGDAAVALDEDVEIWAAAITDEDWQRSRRQLCSGDWLRLRQSHSLEAEGQRLEQLYHEVCGEAGQSLR